MEVLVKSIDTAELQNGSIAEMRIDVITGNRSLFAKRVFQENEVITPFYWTKVYDTPNYLTIQIAERQHVELLPAWLECTNHSCDPNAFFDTTKKQLVCIKPIANGEEITFFYPSSEWDIDRAFECGCNSSHCLGHIAGAKHLAKEEKAHYRFTDFIKQKMGIKTRRRLLNSRDL
jgi:hypothetical protein